MMKTRSFFSSALATILCLACVNSGAALAQVAGSVEAGLQSLAQEIVAKSTAADRNTIAVLPFPHSEGYCSILSTYLVDELILNLFSVPNASLRIVERSQLEAIINENQLGESILDPRTTQQLGNLSGVKALVVGTITQVGDAVRINARLIATDTGQTVSAAAVTVPRTNAVNELLRQQTGSGPTCRSGAGSPGRLRPQQGLRPLPRGDEQMTVAGLRGTVTMAGRSRDRKNITVSLMVENVWGCPGRCCKCEVGVAPLSL